MVRAIVTHQIGRVGCEEDRPLSIHDTPHILDIGGVAAQETMVPKFIKVARLRDRIDRWRHGRVAVALGGIQPFEQVVERVLVEPGQIEIELPVQFLEQLLQAILIGFSQFRQSVRGHELRGA